MPAPVHDQLASSIAILLVCALAIKFQQAARTLPDVNICARRGESEEPAHASTHMMPESVQDSSHHLTRPVRAAVDSLDHVEWLQQVAAQEAQEEP